MDRIRKPCQGVLNIIRFNWHYYALAIPFLAGMYFIHKYAPSPYGDIAEVIMIVGILNILISLVVSTYVYDFSALYKLTWLNQFEIGKDDTLVNVHAGFDETSILLKQKFISPTTENNLKVFDFYDPEKHTEVSIKRARKAYGAYPETIAIDTSQLPLPNESTDVVFAILAAHEIRNEAERILFFKELKRILKPDGVIMVTEHLRDLPNFLAYNIGFFHFHSKATWLRTFEGAGLTVKMKIKISPFITTFILSKNGTAS